MEEKIKAALLDYDGSITNKKGEIESSVAVIHDLCDIIPVGLATGKSANFCKNLAKMIIGKDWPFFVAENGGIIKVGGQNDGHSSIDNIHLEIFKSLIGLIPEESRFSFGSCELEKKETILTLYAPGRSVEVADKWVSFFKEIIRKEKLQLEAQRHPDGGIDVFSSLLNKGLGVKEVCSAYGIQQKSILTVGDGPNDFELLRGTTAIAVANASPELKELVRQQGGYVAARSYELGFLEGLKFFAEKGKFGKDNSKKIKNMLRKHALWQKGE